MIWPFSLFKRRDPRQNHDFSHDDQQAGAEVNKAKASLKRKELELQEKKIELEAERDQIKLEAEIEKYNRMLDDLRGDDEEEEEPANNSPDNALNNLVSLFIAQKMGLSAPQGQPTTSIQATPEGEPTNDQLRELWRKLPDNYKQQALGMISK